MSTAIQNAKQMEEPSSSERLAYPPSQPASFISDSENGPEIQQSDSTDGLSPVDKGKTAYFFLCAAFVVEAVTWSFPATSVKPLLELLPFG